MTKSCQLVQITWVDSLQPYPSWQHLSAFEKAKAPLCASVGYLLQNDKDVKVLAQSIGGMEDESGGSAQSMGRMVIPTRCVLKIQPLHERTPRKVKRRR